MLWRSRVLNHTAVDVKMKRGVRKREEAMIELLDIGLFIAVRMTRRADAEEQAGTAVTTQNTPPYPP